MISYICSMMYAQMPSQAAIQPNPSLHSIVSTNHNIAYLDEDGLPQTVQLTGQDMAEVRQMVRMKMAAKRGDQKGLAGYGCGIGSLTSVTSQGSAGSETSARSLTTQR